MTHPVIVASDDLLIELAILGVLAEQCEIYPSFLIGELRRRAPGLAEGRIRPVLERLWTERRVARIWHRYLLPRDVPRVRDKWLAMIDRKRPDFEATDGDLSGWRASRAILTRWDGWNEQKQAA